MTSVAEQYEHQPSPRIARFVERAVGYRLVGHPAGIHVGMPSGTVTLVVPLDAPLMLSGAGLSDPRSFTGVLAGLATAPTLIHHDGTQHGVQLALRPGTARALFGCRDGDLAGSSFELADVTGPVAHTLRERLHESDSWHERFARVEEMLVGLDRDDCHLPGPAPEVVEAWRLIVVSGGRTPIRKVARRVGWSMRRLQSGFRAELGVTPRPLPSCSASRGLCRSSPRASCR